MRASWLCEVGVGEEKGWVGWRWGNGLLYLGIRKLVLRYLCILKKGLYQCP